MTWPRVSLGPPRKNGRISRSRHNPVQLAVLLTEIFFFLPFFYFLFYGGTSLKHNKRDIYLLKIGYFYLQEKRRADLKIIFFSFLFGSVWLDDKKKKK